MLWHFPLCNLAEKACKKSTKEEFFLPFSGPLRNVFDFLCEPAIPINSVVLEITFDTKLFVGAKHFVQILAFLAKIFHSRIKLCVGGAGLLDQISVLFCDSCHRVEMKNSDPEAKLFQPLMEAVDLSFRNTFLVGSSFLGLQFRC
jgi:hypothetical protein